LTDTPRTLLIVAGVAAALGVGTGTRTASAHNDWGLPLVGGLVGGYALSSITHRGGSGRHGPHEQTVSQPVYVAPAPTYVAPAPAPAAPAASSAATIEHQLNVLDELAAKGYITQSEYQSRRQALLDQL
jgi:hypothetical protein